MLFTLFVRGALVLRSPPIARRAPDALRVIDAAIRRRARIATFVVTASRTYNPQQVRRHSPGESLRQQHPNRQSPCQWLAVAVIIVAISPVGDVAAQTETSPAARDQARRSRFAHSASVDPEASSAGIRGVAVREALTGYDSLTNGFDPQGQDFTTLTAQSAVGLRSYNDNRFIFEEFETAAEGLGPTYNAQSCRECHQNVVTGGASQVTEQRYRPSAERQFFRFARWLVDPVTRNLP